MPLGRREFLSAGIAAAALAAAGTVKAQESKPAGAASSSSGTGNAAQFKMLYAPHFGMFDKHAGKDIFAQLQFMHDEGFRALEDNGLPKRPVEEQEKLGKELDRLGMTMGVFVTHMDFNNPTFTTKDPEIRERIIADVKNGVEIAKRVNAKWATVVLGQVNPKIDYDYQMVNAIENLKFAAEIFEKENLVMVMEPLNPWNHPLLFLTKISQAYAICKAVNSPAVKILNDLYHQQITEGNLIPNINEAWDETPYFQVGDNPGRKEPTTGEINYKNIFKHLHAKGYKGVIGMEHGKLNNTKEGERALINAYREVDSF